MPQCLCKQVAVAALICVVVVVHVALVWLSGCPLVAAFVALNTYLFFHRRRRRLRRRFSLFILLFAPAHESCP